MQLPHVSAPDLAPTFSAADGRRLPLEGTTVTATLSGPIASVRVEQVFIGPELEGGGGSIEATYRFPLPHGASVTALEFRIGQRTVKGVVREKEEARRRFAKARAQGRTATLLEQARADLFEMNVTQIQPGDRVEVTLRYQQPLFYDDGQWRFVYPMAVAERYGAERAAPGGTGGAGGAASARSIGMPEFQLTAELKNPGEPGEAPWSPSHAIDVTPTGPGAYAIRLAEERPNPMDFVLCFNAGSEDGPLVVFQRRRDRPGTFLLALTPPPLGEQAPPRDVLLLIDRSLSMRGRSLEQARIAVAEILDQLADGDGIHLVAFDHDRERFGSGNPAAPAQWLPLTDERRRAALAWMETLTPRGGSEIERALEIAGRMEVREGRASLVVLITDAAVGNEGRLLRKLPEQLGERRLYVLGIGPAVNRHLIERLGRAGGGASDVVLPREGLSDAVRRFARRVRAGGPALRGLELSWDEALTADVYPRPLPDLFGGQPVRVVGRFSGEGPTTLRLTGTRPDGQPREITAQVDLPEVADDAPGLERIWARRRIADRLEHLEANPTAASDVRLEVLGLALKHQLVSPYTAFIAEDSERRGAAEPERVTVPTPQAGSVDDEAEAEATTAGRGTTGRGTTGGGSSGGADAGEGATGAVAPGEVTRSPAKRKVRRAGRPPSRSRTEPAATSMFAVPAPRAARSPGGAPGVGSAPPSRAAPSSSPAPASSPPPVAPVAPVAPASLGARVMSDAAPMPAPQAARKVSAAARGGGGLLGKAAELFGGIADSVSGFLSADEPAEPEPELDLDDMTLDEVVLEAEPADRALDEERTGATERRLTLPDRPTPSAKPSKPAPVVRPPTQQQPVADSQHNREAGYTAEELAFIAAQPDAGELDLVFVVDETGSMGPYIAQVRRHIQALITAISGSVLCRSLRIGLVGFRDHPPQDRSFVTRVTPLTQDIEVIRAGVARMRASGGGDGPEAVTQALFDLVRLGWRPNAARTAVLIGDAPPHGVEPRGDGFPKGPPTGHHWVTQSENCREMNITVHAVGCMRGMRSFTGAEAAFRTIAQISRGLFLPLQEAQKLVALIVGVAETELDKQRIECEVAKVIEEQGSALEKLDEEQRLDHITTQLKERSVRVRGLQDSQMAFRDVQLGDVEEGLSKLRRRRVTDL